MLKFRSLLPFALSLLAATSLCPAQGMVPWTTRNFDMARSGFNPNETTLTQASVARKGLRLVTTIPVLGDARGMEAQPLIDPGVKLTADASTHDVLILPSMANQIRGVDAHTGAGLWSLVLPGVPVNDTANTDMHQINDHWGCLSTGWLDPDTHLVYLVCEVSIDNSGTPQSGSYFLYGIDTRSGRLTGPPIAVQGTDRSMWKQRSSLAEHTYNGRKTIFFAHGSVYEIVTGYTGGITAYDIPSKTLFTLPMTSGIWMAGCGLVVDPDGSIYAITGNGDFDPAKGFFGESFIRVQYTPPTATAKAALAVVDQWSPWTDFDRAGQELPASAKVSGMSMPSELARPVGGSMSTNLQNATLRAVRDDQGQYKVLVYPMATGGWSDEDWGSAGPGCVFALHVCVASGKDGIGYSLNTRNLGHTTAQTVGTRANYAALAAPCAWLTMSPGPLPCDPADSRALNFYPNGVTAHSHMTPVQFYDPVLRSWTIFVWGENSQLHKWAVAPTGQLTYIAQSAEFASADSRSRTPGGMPGGFCTGSSNGSDPNSALLVCSIPYGDANSTITNGRLLVYDPVHLNPNGTLKVLWDSQAWGISYVFNKFMPPVIDGGEILLPNYSGGVLLFE